MTVDLADLLLDSGAIRRGHFVLDSGLHASRYFQAVDLLGLPSVAVEVFDRFVELVGDVEPAATVGANEAGSVMSWAIAARLGVEPHFARRDGDAYRVIGGRPLPDGPVLVVDDITTTGGTARKLVDATRRAGGDPTCVGVLATKGLRSFDLGVPVRTLVPLPGMDAVEAAECRACAEGTPLTG